MIFNGARFVLLLVGLSMFAVTAYLFLQFTVSYVPVRDEYLYGGLGAAIIGAIFTAAGFAAESEKKVNDL